MAENKDTVEKQPVVIPDNMILVDAKVLTDTINLIHSTHGKAIDSYNGLVNAVVGSGKVKMK